MTGLYEAYLYNIIAAQDLAKPHISPGMSGEQIIAAIRSGAERLFQIHQDNDRILKDILFSRKPQELSAEEAGQLSELAGALFNHNRSPDVGVAYRIHRLLYAYAQHHRDRALMIRELYFQGITLMYLNVRDSKLGLDLFVEGIDLYFSAGAACLEQYEEIQDPETRAYIIRCLGNLKYGLTSYRGSPSPKGELHMRDGWEDYMACFDRAMAVIQSPHYRSLDPGLPWDSFAYAMHYDRTEFLTVLQHNHDPVIAQAMLESAQFIQAYQSQSANVQERFVSNRTTRYTCLAARYHAGLAPLEELLETLYDMCEEADIHDFSGDNIWVILCAPEYLLTYARRLSPEDFLRWEPRVQHIIEKQKEYLFLLPRNEYSLQVSRSLQNIISQSTETDEQFKRRILDYILACHAPTFVHSKMVALLTRRFCERLLETAPALLNGAFDLDLGPEHPENHKILLELAYLCGLYHDLGKCMLLNSVGMYSRSLLDEEFLCIQHHPVFGCNLLESLGMSSISSVSYFHHRSYDRAGGYPKGERPLPENVRRIIDIVTVVDSLDAGTDNIGRSYAAAKTYDQLVEELLRGSGTRYAPEIVALLRDDPFRREIGEFIQNNRIAVYLDVYRKKQDI